MNNKEDIKIIDKNIALSILFIVSITISILIAYNQKLEKQKKDLLFSTNTSRNLNLSNRIFVLLLLIGFLILNYKEYELGLRKGRNIEPLKHQLWASILSISAALVALYVVIENLEQNFQIFSIENPTI